jgi:hypothetical protein
MQIKTRIAARLIALCGAIGTAQAHNVWLLPSSTVLSKAEWITVDAAVSNDLFFFNHFPLALDNLTVTAPDGSEAKPENMHRGKLRSVFDLNLTQSGTYRLAVVSSGLNASYKDAGGQPKRWRGTPEKFAAEVPADAKDLKVTQSAGRIETFFHVDGKPAAGLEVVLVAGGSRYRDALNEIKATTDAKGEFSVTWPAAGMYWVDADANDGKTTLPQAKERRLSYVGTVEVLP